MTFKLIFSVVPFIVWALTYIIFIRPGRLGKVARRVWAGALFVCFGKFMWFKLLGGDAFVPDLPEKLIWLMNWLYSGAVVLFALSMLSFFLRFRFKMLLLSVVSWLLAGWGVWNGIRLPEIEELEFQYADLPSELDGYRIVHISDIHVTTAARRWRTEGIVEMVNSLNPDLICITGDMMDGDPDKFLKLIEDGYVIEEKAERENAIGRTPGYLRINTQKNFVFGLDINKSGLNGIVMNLAGNTLKDYHGDVTLNNKNDTINEIISFVEQIYNALIKKYSSILETVFIDTFSAKVKGM